MCMRTISDKWQYIYIYSDINAICKSNTYTYIDVFTILDVLIWIITFFIIVYLHDVYLYILRYIISIENNTWMCGNIWNLFRVFTRISHEGTKRTSEISCSTWEIISCFQASMHCSVYYIKKLVVLPHKNRAVYSNGFCGNWHMWDYQE